MPKPLPPKTNWQAVEIRDGAKSEPDARCALCNRKIRWLHVIEHAKWPVPKIVGVCCAQRLCRDYDADGVEREFKNKQSRRMRFVEKRKWNVSKNNSANVWRDVRMKTGQVIRVVIHCKGGWYGILIAGPGKGNTTNSPYWHKSQSEALNEAFEIVDGL